MIEVDLGKVVLDDYEELSGKPKINGVELSGDKTFEELGFEGTKDYEVLENKPCIEGVELSGNKTLEELGIASKEELDKTVFKVDTIIEKADLGIKETAIGEEIHLTDSADGKAVEYALYGKATQDGTPSPENPVDIVVAGESYNLFKNTATSQTISGVTYTVNEEDGSVKANGTATADTILVMGKTLLDEGEYIVKGGYTQPYIRVGKGTNNTYVTHDTGNGARFEALSGEQYWISIIVSKDNKVDNITVYPMLCKASVPNDRYMPYGVGSVEVDSRRKNFLKNTATTQTINGVEFVVNNDKSITANGTATARVNLTVCKLPNFNERCILTGCPNGGGIDKYRLEYTNYKDFAYQEHGAGVEIEKFDYSNYPEARVNIRIESGITLNNMTFYPMIRLATDTDATYEPYKGKTATIPTTNGLAGIKVDSGGNYTDTNGQQWICDEVVKYADGSGEYVQRVKKIVLNGSETWTKQTKYFNTGRYTDINGVDINFISNVGKTSYKVLDGSPHGYGLAYAHGFRLDFENMNVSSNTVDELKSYLGTNPIIAYAQLLEPIITPLTAQQLADIETFYPVTNISNDFDCEMKVKYKCDGKNYIDKRLALIEQALINNI